MNQRHIPERLPETDLELLELGLELQEGLPQEMRHRLAAIILGGDLRPGRAAETIPAPPSTRTSG